MSERTDLATAIVRALWPSEQREQVLDARIKIVREVLEREEKMEKKEPSELAVKIAETINRETQLNAYAPWIAELVSDSGLSDLEAKLEAKERELEEMRGRLGEIASKSNPGNFWSDTLGHAKPETVRRMMGRIHRLATEKGGKEGNNA